jgi:hypothetical protein
VRVSVHGDELVIAEFEKFAAELPEGSKRVVKDALQNIKTEWAHEWTGRFRHAPRVHRSITYEITDKGPLIIRGEVGPVDEPINQGYLGRILAYGAEHSGPHPAGDIAADRETLRFEAAVDNLLRKELP